MSSDALLEAYRRHGPALARKAERILHDRAEAHDVVHGLFVELMQRGARDTSLPYLYRAITNRCLNVLRDHRQRQRLLALHAESLPGDGRTRCEEHVMSAQLLARLAARLSAKHLEVLVCRYLDDMSQDEIATFLGTSRKTVGKRLARIRDEVVALAAEEKAR